MRYRAFYETRPGRIIYHLRKAQKMSQEELAGNICSAATISRIENGSQIPTRRMFYRLLEQTGEFGFTYGDYYDGFTLQEMYLKKHIIRELEKEEEEINEHYLWMFYKIYNKKDTNEKQFIEFAKMAYWYRTYPESVDAIERFTQIIRLTHKEFNPQKELKESSYNQIQAMIINCIAVVLLRDGDAITALKLLLHLLKSTKRSNHILPLYYKVRATLYNNLALCELELGQEKEALKHCKKAIQLCRKGGGAEFLIKLLRTEIFCLQRTGQFKIASKHKAIVYGLFEILFINTNVDTVEDFLSNSRELMVF